MSNNNPNYNLPSTFMQGGTGLAFQYLAKIQGLMADMEIDYLKLMSGSTQNGTQVEGFYKLMSQLAYVGLQNANQQANDLQLAGYMEMASNIGTGVGQLGGLAVGAYQCSGGPNAALENAQNELSEFNKTQGQLITKPTNTPQPAAVVAGEEDGLELQPIGSEGAQMDVVEEPQTPANKEKQTALIKQRKELEDKLTYAQQHIANIKTLANSYCQLFGTASQAVFSPLDKKFQADGTKAQGESQFATGISSQLNTEMGVANGAVNNLEGARQGAAQALLQIIQLSAPRA
jgi:hypothetical protein